jgi:phenylacetate-CoA ligase
VHEVPAMSVLATSPLSPSKREGLEPASLYAWTYEHLLFPTWQKVMRGRSIFDHLAQMESTQWLCRDELEALQLRDLRALLDHAGANVPYYRELFGKVGLDPRGVTSVRDLAVLPPLTREIIHERYDDLIDPAHRGKNIKKGTSGTSGAPLKFEYGNESEAWRQAVRIRAYRWAGFRLGLPTLHYWAQGADLPHGIRAAKVKLDRALRRDVYVDAVRQDEKALMETVEIIRRMKPHVIVAYTQAAAHLARFILDRDLRDWDDIPVICGAEAVLAADRSALRRAFGRGIFETTAWEEEEGAWVRKREHG